MEAILATVTNLMVQKGFATTSHIQLEHFLIRISHQNKHFYLKAFGLPRPEPGTFDMSSEPIAMRGLVTNHCRNFAPSERKQS